MSQAESRKTGVDCVPCPIRIGVVAIDHNPILLEGIVVLIHSEPDMRLLGAANSASEGIALYLSHTPDITIIDLDLPQMGAFDAIHRILSANPRAKLIGLATYEFDESAPRAMRAGVLLVLAKDRIGDELVPQIRRAMRHNC